MAWPDRGTPPPIDARSPTAGDARSVETSFRRSLHRATILPIVLLTVGSIFLVALVLGLRGAHRWVDHTDVVIGRANLLQKLTV